MRGLRFAIFALLVAPWVALADRVELPEQATWPAAIAFGADGRGWIGTATDRLWRFDTALRTSPFTSTRARGGRVAVAEDGVVWVAGERGIRGHDPESGAVVASLAIEGNRNIDAGADGNLWVVRDSEVVKLSRTGTVLARYGVAGSLGDAAFAADGALWILTRDAGLIRLTTGGKVSRFELPFTPGFIFSAPGGLWLAGGTAAARMDLTGKLTGAWTLRRSVVEPFVAAVDARGNLWIADAKGLARLTATGAFTRFEGSPTRCADAMATGLAFSPSGELWLLETACGRDFVGRVDVASLRVARQSVLKAGAATPMPMRGAFQVLIFATAITFAAVFKAFR